jgi:hypothetical protein
MKIDKLIQTAHAEQQKRQAEFAPLETLVRRLHNHLMDGKVTKLDISTFSVMCGPGWISIHSMNELCVSITENKPIEVDLTGPKYLTKDYSETALLLSTLRDIFSESDSSTPRLSPIPQR